MRSNTHFKIINISGPIHQNLNKSKLLEQKKQRFVKEFKDIKDMLQKGYVFQGQFKDRKKLRTIQGIRGIQGTLVTLM